MRFAKQMLLSTYPIHCVVRKFVHLANSDLETFRYGTSTVASVVNVVRPTTVASLSHWASTFVYNTVDMTHVHVGYCSLPSVMDLRNVNKCSDNITALCLHVFNSETAHTAVRRATTAVTTSRTGATRTRTLLTTCKDLQNNLWNILNIETATSTAATHPAVIEMQAISPVNSQQYNISLVHLVGDISVLKKLFKYQR